MIVLEAWSRQRPVVAHRIGALAETITNEVNGLLVDPDDTNSLARAMENLLMDPDKTQSMGRAGWQTLQTDFGKSRWRSRMESIYQQVLGR
jgi:glycosyltransferase involved in cell wall biosynthesis